MRTRQINTNEEESKMTALAKWSILVGLVIILLTIATRTNQDESPARQEVVSVGDTTSATLAAKTRIWEPDESEASGLMSPIRRNRDASRPRPLVAEEILVKFETTTDECRTRDVTSDGVTRAKTSCQVSLRFDHPYDAFSLDQLLQIHETDAVASYILGMKTFHDKDWRQYFEYETSVNHLHRAAMLSGKAQPYLDMLRSRKLDGPDAPSTEFALRESYVWYEAGIRAGVIQSGDRPDWMSSLALQLPPETVREWNIEADEYAEKMVNLRAYKTGDSF